MLTLSVPHIDAALQLVVEARPRAAAAWLARLPLASPVDAAQQLLTALYALNRHPLDADARLALLAQFRPTVARAVAGLEAQLAESGVPPHAQQLQMGMLLRELLVESTIGYKQVLLAMTGNETRRVSARRLAEATARALTALRDVLTASYLTYSPLPVGLWREIHAVYRFARTSNLADSAVQDAPPPGLAYRQALLIALADPPHMNPAELAHTRLYLDKFAALAELTAEPVNGHRGFPIQSEGDAPPSHLSLGQPGNGPWLDTDALCRHLHATAVHLSTGDTPRRVGLPAEMETETSQKLCARLLKLWGGGIHRVFRRYTAPGSQVQVVTGLSAIHRLLIEWQLFDEIDQDGDGNLPIRVSEPAFTAHADVSVTRWTVRNDSAAGLALSGTPNTPLNLKVGDPLAVQDEDIPSGWSLAVIRWVRMCDTNRVEFGAERLSPLIEPVWVRPLRGHRQASLEPALLVLGLPALNRDDCLMLPRHIYQIGMDAEVSHAPNQYTLTFGRRVEHTPSFDLINFTVFASEQP